jgi:hypothetical protein
LIEIEEHISTCRDCSLFREDLKKIRELTKKGTKLTLSQKIDRETRSLCHSRLISLSAVSPKKSFKQDFYSIPKVIWSALFVLVLITVSLIFLSINEIELKFPLTFETSMILTLIIQNTFMLFFAPVLIRGYKKRSQRKIIINGVT